MRVNLKELSKQIELLKHIQTLPMEKSISNKLSKLIFQQEEIERDLEMGGECSLELDKPRLEAIDERNRAIMRKGEQNEF